MFIIVLKFCRDHPSLLFDIEPKLLSVCVYIYIYMTIKYDQYVPHHYFNLVKFM